MKTRPCDWTMFASGVLVAAISAAASGAVIYVDAKATGAGDGTSWIDAFPALQPALAAAHAGDEIWVVAGTYAPAPANGPRSATFALVPGAALYGGFAGGESTLEQRDWIANPTILTGDLNADDGPPPAPGQSFVNIAENSLHVVSALEAGTAGVLDGFTIASGNANQPANLFGGGLNVKRPASIDVRNCTFIANRAQLGGGAIAFTGNSSTAEATALISDCTFYRNSAGSNGGAIHRTGTGEQLIHIYRCAFVENRTTESNSIGGGALHTDFAFALQIVENCTFVGNQSHVGSAIAIYSSSVTVSNCLLAGNHCRAGGYAVMFNFGPADITNCTIVNNTTEDGSSGGIAHGGDITNCIIRGNIAAQFSNSEFVNVRYSNIEGGWPGLGNIDADPLFVDSTAGNFRLLQASPCIDAGDNAEASAASVDLDGQPRIVDGDGDATAVVDMGAYEHQPQAKFPGDANGDGTVDVDDLVAVILSWGACGDCPPPSCPADFDDDCDVDVDDLVTVILNWE